MSIAVMTQVWDTSKEKGTALLLLLALADFANAEGIAWPSIETLAQRARISERQTQYIIHSLEADGELYVMQAIGRGNVNRYFIPHGLQSEKVERTLKGEIFAPFIWTEVDRKRKIENTEKVKSGAEKVQSSAIKGAIAIAPDPLDPSIEPSVTGDDRVLSSPVRDPLAEELDAPIIGNKQLDAFKEKQSVQTLSLENAETKQDLTPPVPVAPLSVAERGLAKPAEPDWAIPQGYKLLTSTNSDEPLHLLRASKGRFGDVLCKKKFPFRTFPTGENVRIHKPCEECWRIALLPPEQKPPPKSRPVFDAIALGSFNMTKVNGQGGRIGKLEKGIRECQPVPITDEQLAADLAAMYAWYKTAYHLSAPASVETICKYLAEWRALTTSAPYTPPRVSHSRYVTDPQTGKARPEPCYCEIGHTHDA